MLIFKLMKAEKNKIKSLAAERSSLKRMGVKNTHAHDAILTDNQFQLASLSEKRAVNAIIRVLKKWRQPNYALDLNILPTAGTLGDVVGEDKDRLKRLLQSFSLGTNEFLKGMSADVILRGSLNETPVRSSSNTNIPVASDAVQTPCKRTVMVVVNVEVDGQMHEIGRKSRFQQLRDAHLQKIEGWVLC